MLSFNLIRAFNNQSLLYSKQDSVVKNICVFDYVQKLCIYSGSSLQGSLMASAKLLKNTRKLPIFLANFNDYLIPLASPSSAECCWFSAKNYLTCFEKDNRFFIKFIDRSIVEVNYSTYTIKNQYQKYMDLVRQRDKLYAHIVLNKRRVFDE